MKSKTADVVFVFPPAHGNIGVFKNHLGVAYLRTALARDGINTLQYLNEHPGTVDSVAGDILELRPRIVGFTAYDANFLLALSLSRALKRRQPDLKVVMGGPTSTFGAEALLSIHDVIDVCVTGEAEETASHIFSTMLDGRPLDETHAGAAFRRDGAVVCNDLPPLVGCNCPDVYSALDVAPSPYLSGILADGRAGVLSGRGCTHQCQYCVFAALGRKKLRLHSTERVLAELEYIADQQKRSGQSYVVAIHDDAFTLLPKRAKELCQAIADRNLGLVLSAITRADTIDDELLQLLRAAGFISVAFGLESAVPSVLRATGKVRPPDHPDPNLEPERHFVEQVRSSVIGAKKLGFSVGVSIILGLPSETAEDGAATLRFVKELPVDFYMHNFLWVFPGTPLWDTHERYNVKCSLNKMGLPETYQYAYDVASLRPRPKCSLEQDAKTLRLLATDALMACEGDSGKPGSIQVVSLDAPAMSPATAAWLAQVLGVGGIVLHRYPLLKRSEEAVRLYEDRCTLSEHLAPARHYAQVLPKRRGGETGERLRVVSSGVDLYDRHKPALLSIVASAGPGPLLDWAKGSFPSGDLCELGGYLQAADELASFLDGMAEEEIGPKLRRMPIPPGLAYPGRWLRGEAPCLALTRIEVDAQGQVRPCRFGEPIGTVGDSQESMAERLQALHHAAEERRGCARCSNTHCPRCPFPGVDDATYCEIQTHQSRVLRLLDRVHLYARLPLVIGAQRDRMASD